MSSGRTRPRTGEISNASLNSRYKVKARFSNKTDDIVIVRWHNFEGVPVEYKRLESKESYEVTTYITHPWTFVDNLGERLGVQVPGYRHPVFETLYFCSTLFGVATRTQLQQMLSGRAVIGVNIVDAVYPQYTLRHLALATVARVLKEVGRDRGEVRQLELPEVLEKELKDRME